MKKLPFCVCLLLFVTAAMILCPLAACGQVFHVVTPQDLQNALTISATNGVDNYIYITNGYYTGNFNYNSAGVSALTIANEPSVANTAITVDGAGTGRDMNLATIGNVTVKGITFLRNCGNANIGALRIAAAGGGSSILVQNCQFLSPSSSSGMGLELDAGVNATITNCVVIGSTSGGASTGISISGVTGAVSLQNCTLTTNRAGGVSISGTGVVNLTGNSITANSAGYGGGVLMANLNSATLSGNFFANNSGDSSEGGAVGFWPNSGGSLIVSNNTFSGNTAGFGGGVESRGGATIIGNTFTGNGGAANCYGGGVYCGGAATITGNTFSGNAIGFGGGVYCGGAATITGNTFSGNTSLTSGSDSFFGGSGGGGGINVVGFVMLIGNTFSGNSSAYTGGGVYCASGGIISSNIFAQNASPTGGGLYVVGSSVTMQDNLVVNNSQTSATSQGGGLWVDASSSLYMVNNTIFGNTAQGSGGGAAFQVTGTVELLNVYNNIIWGNAASGNGGDVWLAGTGQQKVFEYNDVSSMYGVWDIAQNNIDLSPKFFNPVGGDFHTQSTSPCIAAGTTNAPSVPATDLDGNPRILNGTVDIGCYEFTTNVFHPADLVGAWTITPADFTAYATAWKSGQTWTNAPNPIPANYLTRAGYLMTNGGAYYNDGSARPVNWKINP